MDAPSKSWHKATPFGTAHRLTQPLLAPLAGMARHTPMLPSPPQPPSPRLRGANASRSTLSLHPNTAAVLSLWGWKSAGAGVLRPSPLVHNLAAAKARATPLASKRPRLALIHAAGQLFWAAQPSGPSARACWSYPWAPPTTPTVTLPLFSISSPKCEETTPPPQPPPSKTGDLTMRPMAVKKVSQKKKW